MTNFFLKEALIDLSDEMSTDIDGRIKYLVSSAIYYLSDNEVNSATVVLRGIKAPSLRVSRVLAMLTIAESV